MLNRIIIVLILMILVVGCGRISKPKVPEGSTYDYSYSVSQDEE